MSRWESWFWRDLALGALAAAAATAESLSSSHNQGPAWVNVAFAIAAGVCVAVRRRFPFEACLVLFALAIAIGQVGTPVSAMSTVIFIVALMTYTAGRELETVRAIVVFVAVVATVIVVDATGPTSQQFSSGLFPIGVFVLTWGVGRVLRNHAQLTRELAITNEQLDAELQQRARDAVADERRRIARELHDVVAHSVSVMVVQSGAARRTLERDSERAEQALAAAEESGRTALVELRRMLGLMSEDTAKRGPQPTLGQIDTLIARARDAGLDVELRENGERFALPTGADLAAYRVVQEALTNTLKHAGSTRATVTLQWTPDALELEISDAGAQNATVQQLAGSGHGLVGMRERLELYGGHVEAHAGHDGGFVVQASIPRDTVVAA